MIDYKIKRNEDCMGCSACANVCPKNCITMTKDHEYFLYPKVNSSKCVRCRKCIEVCPIMNRAIVNSNPVAFACINNDESVRILSSSGGMFTIFAERVLENGGVVFGASLNNQHKLKHVYIDNKKDLELLRGSKYVQSEIGYTYKQAKEFLDSEKEVLFVGTPCQIAGLKNYLKSPYKNLITLDIICHGVPSPYVWSKYVAFRKDKEGTNIKKISFRNKSNGWKKYSMSFVFSDDTEYKEYFRYDPYMKAFLKDICLRPSCHECKFKSLNRHSDITMGDFWGVKNIAPHLDDNWGTSLILVNSEIGKIEIDAVKDKMKYERVNVEESIKYNLAAIKSARPHTKRNDFFNHLNVMPFDVLVDKYCNDSSMKRIKIEIRRQVKFILSRLGYKK